MILQRIKAHLKELFHYKGVQKSLAWFLVYGIWCSIAPTLFLTVLIVVLLQVNYWTLGQATSLKNLSDYYKQFELVFLGISSLGFILFLKSFSPILTIQFKKIFIQNPLNYFYFFGLAQGTFYGCMIVLALIFSQIYQYLGIFLSYENFNFFFIDFIFNFLFLFLLIHIEEYIFRGEIQRNLQKHFRPFICYIVTSFFYLLIKEIQFELTWSEAFNIFFFSIVLCILYEKAKNYAYGSGLYFGLLISFQFIFSLPIFSREFNSILRVTLSENYPFKYMELQKTVEFLSGGEFGPLASLILLSLSVVFIFHHFMQGFLKKNR